MTPGATRESILCRNEECDRGKPRVSQLMWPGYTEKIKKRRKTNNPERRSEERNKFEGRKAKLKLKSQGSQIMGTKHQVAPEEERSRGPCVVHLEYVICIRVGSALFCSVRPAIRHASFSSSALRIYLDSTTLSTPHYTNISNIS